MIEHVCDMLDDPSMSSATCSPGKIEVKNVVLWCNDVYVFFRMCIPSERKACQRN